MSECKCDGSGEYYYWEYSLPCPVCVPHKYRWNAFDTTEAHRNMPDFLKRERWLSTRGEEE